MVNYDAIRSKKGRKKTNIRFLTHVLCCHQPVPQLSSNRPVTDVFSAKNAMSYAKRHSFLSFPYVCSEPVLVKWCIFCINGAKSGVSDLTEHVVVRKRLQVVALDTRTHTQMHTICTYIYYVYATAVSTFVCTLLG
jgi:hypothetical protein